MTPRFIYFDLGRVLVGFDPKAMLSQIASDANVPVEAVQRAIFDEGIIYDLERGDCDSEEAFERFRRATGASCDQAVLEEAACEAFAIRLDMVPVVASLRAAHFPCGILSNTSLWHWEYCRRTFPGLLDRMDVYALSYELRCAKPDAEIYRKAASLAGVAPEEIFFTDDMPVNVEAAQKAGFDAVLFRGGRALAEELRRRGVRLNC
jgi:glucose-1-phosphatase